MIKVLGNVIDEKGIKAITSVSKAQGPPKVQGEAPTENKYFNIILEHGMYIPVNQTEGHSVEDIETAHAKLVEFLGAKEL